MLARHWLFAAAAHGHKDALDHVNWAGAKRPRVEQKWMDLMEDRGWVWNVEMLKFWFEWLHWRVDHTFGTAEHLVLNWSRTWLVGPSWLLDPFFRIGMVWNRPDYENECVLTRLPLRACLDKSRVSLCLKQGHAKTSAPESQESEAHWWYLMVMFSSCGISIGSSANMSHSLLEANACRAHQLHLDP